MKLWAANTTKKVIHFLYRVPGSEKLHKLEIPIGAQAEVHRTRDGLDQPTCDALVDQLRRKLAAVEAKERPEGYVGVTYSVDKPVKAEAIVAAVEANDGVLTQQGAELRKDAAIATHNAIAEAGGGNPADLALTTVSVEEEVKPGEERKVDQTTVVARNGEAGAAEGKTARRRKR